MNEERVIERLFTALIAGDRQAARTVIEEARQDASAESISHHVYWPVIESISKLYRGDQLTKLAHNYSTRLLGSLLDQAQADYTHQPSRDRKVLMFSGQEETDELAGRLVADLLEADGYEVFFAGGGVANDEVLSEVGEYRPDVLLMFSSSPNDAPNIRELIDTVRDVSAVPDLQFVVGGGVFNRAMGLAEEIGADLWAVTPAELLHKLAEQPQRRATPGQRTVGRNRHNTKATKAA